MSRRLLKLVAWSGCGLGVVMFGAYRIGREEGLAVERARQEFLAVVDQGLKDRERFLDEIDDAGPDSA